MSNNAASKEAIVIEQTFDAPVELIWQLWTEPEHLKHWYGPKGFSVPVAELDVRVGGKHHICMATPDGSQNFWTVGEYTEIIPHKRLVYTDSMSDEHGNVLNHEGHPLITEVKVQLEDLNGRTKMVVTHAGLPANEQGAAEGWEQALASLKDYLQTVRAA